MKLRRATLETGFMPKRGERKKVGVLLRALDPLFMEAQSPNADFLYFVLRGGRDAELAKVLLDDTQIVTLSRKADAPSCASLSTGDLLSWTDLKAKAKRHSLDAFLISHRGTKSLDAWSKQAHISLISTPLADQLRFEDKIWFDEFLRSHNLPKPRSAKIVAAKGLPLPFPGKAVIQKPLSFGGVGTFFVSSARELSSLLRSGAIESGEQLLAREFAPGRTYGVTIWVGPDVVACSAVREQCFFKNRSLQNSAPPAPRLFAGIQWVPSSSFAPGTRRHISEVLKALGQVLHREKFFGFANIDFLVTPEGKVLILECNPRLSSATPQLLAEPRLIHSLPVGKRFIEQAGETLKYKRHPKLLGLPSGNYSGALFDLPAQDPAGPFATAQSEIAKEATNGRYELKGGRLAFLGPDLRRLSKGAHEFIFFSEHRTGERVAGDETTGTIISHSPLFTNKGFPSALALKLMKRFQTARPLTGKNGNESAT
jgi:hypothetical protein